MGTEALIAGGLAAASERGFGGRDGECGHRNEDPATEWWLRWNREKERSVHRRVPRRTKYIYEIARNLSSIEYRSFVAIPKSPSEGNGASRADYRADVIRE